MDARDLPDPLDRLGHALADAEDIVGQGESAERDRLRGLIRSAREALRATANALPKRAADSSAALPSATVAAWIHGLRGPVTAIVGWAHILRETPDEDRRGRAVHGIERNAGRRSWRCSSGGREGSSRHRVPERVASMGGMNTAGRIPVAQRGARSGGTRMA